jgi:pimeloyl-ACP methyl ester carboxylesterase
MVITPVLFVLVFEIARSGIDGPTVDGIHLNSTYGIIAFVLGRVFHGILVLLPLVLGTSYGIVIAQRLGNNESAKISSLGWIINGLLTLAVIAIFILIARPATTQQIIGPNGNPVPNSVSEISTVSIGDQDQTIMIRGRDIDNPVLLYLAGGPGGTDLGAMRADVSLEQYFVVVTWEQRGAGKSYAALDPTDTLTLEQMISDTVELTDYLRERFGEEKIYLVGNSWGTILGVLTIQQYPDRYHAYIGTGQMVSPRETDIMFYEDAMQWAQETGNQNLVETLEQNGPPPYDNLLDYEPAISYEHDWNPYPELDMNLEMPAILFVPENNFMDRVNGFRGFLDTFAVLYPQLQEIDFRQDVPSLDVPVYIIHGAHEARGRDVLAREWFEMLDAPAKELIIFDHAGHRPLFEQPGEFADLMTKVLAETYPIHNL